MFNLCSRSQQGWKNEVKTRCFFLSFFIHDVPDSVRPAHIERKPENDYTKLHKATPTLKPTASKCTSDGCGRST